MQIIVLKSNEIDSKLWYSITEGFNESFEKSKTVDDFIDYYHNTVLGYSYHALAFSDTGDLVGSNTIIPHNYIVNETKYLFGLSGGTFVRKKYRKDIFIYKDIMDALVLFCKSEDVKVIYGVPNKNSLKYTTKFLNFSNILNLDYYIIPLKIGNILKLPLRPLINFCSYFTFTILIQVGRIISSFKHDKIKTCPIKIDFNPLFINKRFKNGYKIINENDLFIAYKISLEDDIQTAFLMEYRENGVKSYKSLMKAINLIKKAEKIDIIVYIGLINHFRFSMLKVPFKKQPQQLSLTLKTLTEDNKLNEILLNKKNWDFSLVNYDVR